MRIDAWRAGVVRRREGGRRRIGAGALRAAMRVRQTRQAPSPRHDTALPEPEPRKRDSCLSARQPAFFPPSTVRSAGPVARRWSRPEGGGKADRSHRQQTEVHFPAVVRQRHGGAVELVTRFGQWQIGVEGHRARLDTLPQIGKQERQRPWPSLRRRPGFARRRPARRITCRTAGCRRYWRMSYSRSAQSSPSRCSSASAADG
jgi:hypothetical protein